MAAGLRVLEEEGTKFFSEEAIQTLVRELGLPPVHPVSRPMPHKFAAGTAGGLPQVRGSPSPPSRDTLTGRPAACAGSVRWGCGQQAAVKRRERCLPSVGPLTTNHRPPPANHHPPTGVLHQRVHGLSPTAL
jgi:hypothetical protein